MYRPNAPFEPAHQVRKNPRLQHTKYPWRMLRKTGDCFVWKDLKCYASLRAAASYQTRNTGVKFTVNRLPKKIKVTRL